MVHVVFGCCRQGWKQVGRTTIVREIITRESHNVDFFLCGSCGNRTVNNLARVDADLSWQATQYPVAYLKKVPEAGSPLVEETDETTTA